MTIVAVAGDADAAARLAAAYRPDVTVLDVKNPAMVPVSSARYARLRRRHAWLRSRAATMVHR